MAAPIVEGGFTQEQLEKVRELIFEGINAVHVESSRDLQTASDQLKITATQIEEARTQQLANMQQATAQVDEKIQAIMTHLQTAQGQNAEYMANVATKEQQVTAMIANLTMHAQGKETIIAELNAKQQEMTAFKGIIEQLTLESQRTMHQMTGGWKDQIESTISNIQRTTESTFAEVMGLMNQFQRVGFGGNQGGTTANAGNGIPSLINENKYANSYVFRQP